MISNEDLEKRIEILEKEVKHLKAALQYQIKNQNQDKTNFQYYFSNYKLM